MKKSTDIIFSDLLAIDAPKEVTGRYRIRNSSEAEELSAVIYDKIKDANNSDKGILELLKECSGHIPELLKEDFNALQHVFENGNFNLSFDYTNAIYQAIAGAFRKIPKKQKHTHFFDSIHPAFLWNEMVLYNAKIKKELEASISTHYKDDPFSKELIFKINNYFKNEKLWSEIVDLDFKYNFVNIFDNTKLKPQISVVSLDSWERMVCHIVFQHYSDGVRELWSINNKLWIIDNEWYPEELAAPLEILEATLRGFEKAQQIIAELFEEAIVLKLVPSLYRGHAKCNPESSLKLMKAILSNRRDNEYYQKYIDTIDVSGREAILSESLNTCFIKSSDFIVPVQMAAKEGLSIMIHAGDRGNTSSATGKGKFHREGTTFRSLELAELTDVEEYVKEHLIFFEDALNTLIAAKNSTSKDIDLYINHGTILIPRGSAVTKDPKRKKSGVNNDIFFAGVPVKGEDNLNKIESLLKLLREYNIEIATCPTVNTNSDIVERYQCHPWRQWLKRGNKVSISVDDIFWFKSGVTASDEMTKISLSSKCTMSELNTLFSL